MVGRRRWKSPLQSFRAFPNLSSGFLTSEDRVQHDVQKQNLRGTKDECTDTGDHIPIGEHHVVVGNPTWHARQTGKVRSEEHTSELQSRGHLVCRLVLEKKKQKKYSKT